MYFVKWHKRHGVLPYDKYKAVLLLGSKDFEALVSYLRDIGFPLHGDVISKISPDNGVKSYELEITIQAYDDDEEKILSRRKGIWPGHEYVEL